MSGILDSKSRVIDAILTAEGRRQLAAGTFVVSYASFSDADVVYKPDSENGHEDPSTKIYFEACNLPQDQITFEANDSGDLVPFRSQDIKLPNQGGNVYGNDAQGVLKNGRLTIYQYHHGRRIKASEINENREDDLKGFIYSDVTGLTGSVLINSRLSAGKISYSAPLSGGPHIAYIGTKGGMGSQQFALSISSSIAAINDGGGPQVYVESANDSVYLDSGEDFDKTFILPSGSLSSPLVLERGLVGGNLLADEVKDANFASQIQGILTSSFDNFLKLQTLSTIDRLFEDNEFVLSTNTLKFDLSKATPAMQKVIREAPPKLSSMDSMFSDDKFSNLNNFKYLPPIVKTSETVLPPLERIRIDSIRPYFLGDYPSWGDNSKRLDYKTIMSQVNEFGDIKEPIIFRKTSRENNVIGQMFEVTDTGVSKLDIVRFGYVSDFSSRATNPVKEVYFVGKTFIDDRGTTVFVNMFTLVFSKDDTKDGDETKL